MISSRIAFQIDPTMEEKEDKTQRCILNILKKHQKKFFILFLCLKEVLDCMFDWLLFSKFNALEPGLVYGPIDNQTLQTYYAFCWIGTVVSGIDLLNKVVELCRGKPIINAGYTELCVTILEDIPQLIIGFFIIYCTGESISLLKMKAYFLSFGLYCGMTIMVSPMLAKYPACNIKEEPDEQNTKKCRGLIVIGLSVLCLLYGVQAFLVQGATQDPLDNVGVYYYTGNFKITNGDSENSTWIYFFDVNDIKSHGEITTKVTRNLTYLRIQNIYTRYGNDTDICYRFKTTNEAVRVEPFHCSVLNGTEYYYHFKYLPPSRRHRLGDIQYNARNASNGDCGNATFFHGHLRYFRGYTGQNSASSAMANDSQVTWNRLLNQCSQATYLRRLYRFDEYRDRFYRGYHNYRLLSSEDLFDVTKEWKEVYCHASDAYPHFNPNIPVPHSL